MVFEVHGISPVKGEQHTRKSELVRQMEKRDDELSKALSKGLTKNTYNLDVKHLKNFEPQPMMDHIEIIDPKVRYSKELKCITKKLDFNIKIPEEIKANEKITQGTILERKPMMDHFDTLK